jgi:hypothetical protein
VLQHALGEQYNTLFDPCVADSSIRAPPVMARDYVTNVSFELLKKLLKGNELSGKIILSHRVPF